MSGTITGTVKPHGATVAVDIRDLFALILNPMAYGAAGSVTATTGTMMAGSTTLTLTSAIDFANGQGIYVTGVGPSAAALITTIVSGAGTTSLILSTAASTTTTTNQAVLHDDTAAINAAIVSGSTLYDIKEGYYQVNGGGRTYNISSPLTQMTGLVLENFKLVAQYSSVWVGGAGSSANGVILNPSSNSAQNVICRNIFIDLNGATQEGDAVTNININGLVNFGTANIRYEYCKVIHWSGTGANGGIGFYNGGKCSASYCDFIQWDVADKEAKSPSTYNSGYALYCDMGDSSFHGCNFNSGLRPVYISYNANNVRFSLCHTWPCWNVATSPLPNPTNFEIHGQQITIDNHYLDSGYILIVVDTNNPNPVVSIGVTQSVYDNTNISPYNQWILISTSLANSSLNNIFVSPGSTFGGNIPIIALTTSGGSWSSFPSTTQSSALAAQTENLLTTNGGLLVADGGGTADVATFMSSDGTASVPDSGFSLLNFIDNLTTTTTTPAQVGSNGNDVVLRTGTATGGLVAFRGSSAGLCAIMGPSTGLEGYTGNTVVTNKGNNPALAGIHGAATHPQGYTINFTAAAPNNKTDSAFGFMDTSSTAFKTAIWSDGSIAHPAFGFNVSEFASGSISTSGTYQVAAGQGSPSALAGCYALEWSASGLAQYMVVEVSFTYGDTAALITVVHNYILGGAAVITNPRIVRNSSGNIFLVVSITTSVAGTLNAWARGYVTGLTAPSTPGGSTAISGQTVIVNQTSGGGVPNANAASASSSNTVTNKIKIVVGGITYYLLASTSPI